MKKKYRIENLDCGHCAAKLEEALQKINGVTSAKVNFITSKVTLEIEDDKAESVLEQVMKVTKKTLPDVTLKG